MALQCGLIWTESQDEPTIGAGEYGFYNKHGSSWSDEWLSASQGPCSMELGDRWNQDKENETVDFSFHSIEA
jgi:hypothetical protein